MIEIYREVVKAAKELGVVEAYGTPLAKACLTFLENLVEMKHPDPVLLSAVFCVIAKEMDSTKTVYLHRN